MIRIRTLHHVNVVVADVQAARRFYGELLGLEEVAVLGQPQRDVVWYQLGGAQLHVSYEPDPRNRASGRHVAFVVDDLATARGTLEAAGYPVETPRPLPGIERLFTRDPDGNRIELFAWSASLESSSAAGEAGVSTM